MKAKTLAAFFFPWPTLPILFWWQVGRVSYHLSQKVVRKINELAQLGGAICLAPLLWMMFGDDPVQPHRQKGGAVA